MIWLKGVNAKHKKGLNVHEMLKRIRIIAINIQIVNHKF